MKNRQDRHQMAVSFGLVFLLLLCPLLLAGCGSEESPSLQVVVGGPYVDGDQLAAASQRLLAENPAWQQENLPVEFSAFSFGTQEMDPSMFGVNAMKFSAMAAAGEVDILICDRENAARYARSEGFAPIEQIIPEEKLEGLQERLLDFELLDQDGNPTGEYTPAYGISLSGHPQLDVLYGEQEYGIFLAVNAEPRESAERLFMDLLGL